MRNVAYHDAVGNLPGLPLFLWADTRTTRHHRPVSYAARLLGRRHHLPPARAALVASLAGFHVGEGI